MERRHQEAIEEAAADIIAVADDLGISLIDVLALVEQHIVNKTKVGDALKTEIPSGRRGYTLQDGRMVEVQPRV